MCCPPTQGMLDHLEETGHCLMCSDTGVWGALPCPFCREQEADSALKTIVIPGMVLGGLAIAGFVFFAIRSLVTD